MHDESHEPIYDEFYVGPWIAYWKKSLIDYLYNLTKFEL